VKFFELPHAQNSLGSFHLASDLISFLDFTVDQALIDQNVPTVLTGKSHMDLFGPLKPKPFDCFHPLISG
jgi:hypothetical protein